MKDKLLTIFNTYGKSHQVSKLLEEVGEFIETVINEDKENMVQEIADCTVMLNQFKEYYGITDEEITNNMQLKIKRQLERIENEKSNNIST